jgi:hypothetical protein
MIGDADLHDAHFQTMLSADMLFLSAMWGGRPLMPAGSVRLSGGGNLGLLVVKAPRPVQRC